MRNSLLVGRNIATPRPRCIHVHRVTLPAPERHYASLASVAPEARFRNDPDAAPHERMSAIFPPPRTSEESVAH